MTKEIEIRLRDDFDKEFGDDVQTRYVTWEGVEYELELNERNYATWRNQMQPYLSVARVCRKPARPKPKQKPPPEKKEPRKVDRRTLRAWAQLNGFEVKSRGQISQEVRDAYALAHRSGRRGH